MKLDDIKFMYKYNDWANERILKTTEQVTVEQFTIHNNLSWGSLRGTLVHMLDTEWAWRMLLQHRKNVDLMNEKDFPNLASLRKPWNEEKIAMSDYLNSLTDDDMHEHIKHIDQSSNKNALWHYLWHVVNHGGQHRSECAMILTAFGYSPGELDITEYLKNGD